MELEKQVCSLDLAKRLKELGVKQASLFYWSDGKLLDYEGAVAHDIVTTRAETFAAFTVAELGEMLPLHKIEMKRFEATGSIYCALLGEDGYTMFEDDAPAEAEARAKMLIYLIENKLISL